MDLGTRTLLLIVAILGINQAAMRIERFQGDDRVYWTVQAVDLVLATGIIVFGLPGFEHLPAVSIVVGLVFVMHVAQNYNMRALRQRDERNAEREEIEAEAKRNRDTRAPEEDW